MAEQETQNILAAQELPVEENSEQNNPLAFLDEKPKKKLSKGERKKLRVIKKLLLGEINGTEAAKKLNITTRQVRNLKRQVLNEGTEGVVHKNKNYKPYNTYDTEVSTFICKLYRREYRGTNFSEFARICQEQYGVEASRSTIYNFLRRGRIRSPQRKTKKKKIIEVATSNAKSKIISKKNSSTTKKNQENSKS
ncbi:MAG: helix-turn-helix domain-containing protein [Staphylococcus sp.]|mgnify:FL=1|jgi:integrase family protein|nr:helix-turn-helix domain-containing protein [Staphylococcus sp.]